MMECLQRNYPNQQIKLLYDVSCTLKKHLQVCDRVIMCLLGIQEVYTSQASCRDDLLSVFQLAIPIFHCYGHKLKCQVCTLMIRAAKIFDLLQYSLEFWSIQYLFTWNLFMYVCVI